MQRISFLRPLQISDDRLKVKSNKKEKKKKEKESTKRKQRKMRNKKEYKMYGKRNEKERHENKTRILINSPELLCTNMRAGFEIQL